MTRKQLLARIAKEKHLGTFKGFEHCKQLDIKAVSGVEVTPEILAVINTFALTPLTAEKAYIRKFLLAHNCVDRDRERFPEALLDDFASTLPGKGFLVGHERKSPGKGLFFQAITEEMTPEQFKALTGEDPRLGEGITMVKVLWAWMYMLNNTYNEETTSNIDAGIYRHVSIGFSASDLISVKGQYDQILYWEYVAPGEALEGSLVWLGAQPGATAQKQAGESDEDHDIDNDKTQGGNTMEWKKLLALFKKIFKGKSFGEETFEDDVKTALDEHITAERKAAADEAVKPLKEKILVLETEQAGLKPLAEEGKAYRADLCEKYASAKQKLGDIDDKPESLVKTKEIAGGFGIDFLKAELDVLGKRVEEKFPAESELGTDEDPDKKREKGGNKNALVPDEE